jgi:hypothetical protein
VKWPLLLLVCTPAWAYPPSFQADVPDPAAVLCLYENSTAGHIEQFPVTVSTERGKSEYGYRVCLRSALDWPTGPNSVRLATRTADGRTTDYTAATLPRPSGSVSSARLHRDISVPPPPPPDPTMASIPTEDGTSVANFSAAHGSGLISSGGIFVPTGAGVYDGSYHNTALSTGDHSASAIISAPGSSRYFDIKIRHSGTGGSRNGWQVSVGGTNEWYISEVTGGVGTDRASGTTTLSAGQRITAEGNGTTIRLLINGVQIGSYTSSLYQSQTRVGMGAYTNGSGGLDDFEAQDLASAATSAVPRSPAARLLSILLPNF